MRLLHRVKEHVNPDDARRTAGALGVALIGAGVFWLIGFPSAALTGSALAVTVAGLSGMRVHVPDWLKTLAFVLLGINIGSGVTPAVLASALSWPLSFAILSVSLVASMFIARRGLVHWMGFDRRSGTLAAAPGHLSFVLALSLDKNTDTARIAIVQSIRVLFLTLCVPVLVAYVFGATGQDVLPSKIVALIPAIALIAGTVLVGGLFQRLRLPAAFLLAGIVVSATGHGLELTPGRLPDILVFASFLVMGTMIGSRFSGHSLSDLKGTVLAGVWVTGVNIATSLAAVAATIWALGLSPALLIVAFAPGGVEAMAAIAVSLGLDPAFVAAHHVMRLLLLTLLIPLMLSLVERR